MWGNGALVVWSALFFPLLDTRSIPLIALALSVMLVLQGAYIGTQPAVFSELFRPAFATAAHRSSNTLGTILGGAPAPFIAAALYDATGTSLVRRRLHHRARRRLVAVGHRPTRDANDGHSMKRALSG